MKWDQSRAETHARMKMTARKGLEALNASRALLFVGEMSSLMFVASSSKSKTIAPAR